MALPTESDFATTRDRHVRTTLHDGDLDDLARAAHVDRAQLLDAIEALLPVLQAARVVAVRVPRGHLPTSARQALLELQIALDAACLDRDGLSQREVDEALVDEALVDEAQLEAALGEAAVDDEGARAEAAFDGTSFGEPVVVGAPTLAACDAHEDPYLEPVRLSA